MDRIKPYPQIPIYPEEYEDTNGDIINEKEILLESENRPLQSAKESVFSLPSQMEATAESAFEFNKGNSAERRKIAEDISSQIIQSPDILEEFFDSCDSLAYVDGLDPNYDPSNLKAKILAHLEKTKASPPEDARVFEKWIALYAESALYGQLAEDILARWINAPTNDENFIDRLYLLAHGGLTSSNENVLRKALEIFCFQTKILRADTNKGVDYLLSIFETRNDNILKKGFEIDGALYFLAKLYDNELLEKRYELQDEAIKYNEYFNEKVEEIQNYDPARYNRLEEIHTMGMDEMGLKKFNTEGDFLDDIMIKNHGPLRKWIDRRIVQELAKQKGEYTLVCAFPSGEGVYTFNGWDDLCGTIKQEVMNAKESTELLEPLAWETLAHLAPHELTQEQASALRELSARIKEEIRDQTQHLLSPRGDLIQITDPILQELGFKSILYSMHDEDKQNTVVSVTVGNTVYRAVLDSNFALRGLKDNVGISMPSDGEFIRYVLLSHLHAIRCKGDIIAKTKTGEFVAGEEAKSAFRGRRAHLRLLQEGRNFTEEQYMRAQGHPYFINLSRINAERRARGLKGNYTFVYDAQPSDPNDSDPIVSTAPNAMRDVKDLFN